MQTGKDLGRGMENLFFFLHEALMNLWCQIYAWIKEILRPWAKIDKAAVSCFITGFSSAVVGE